MTSSFLMELKVEFHTCTDSLTTQNLLPCALVHSSCHEDMTARWRMVGTSLLRALSDARDPCKVADLTTASAALLRGLYGQVPPNTTDFPAL
jgi:hypothetical protein